ncbi:unnamed protein product [Brassica rapa subsp. narinosa]
MSHLSNASLFEISLLPRHKSWPKKIWALNKVFFYIF